MRDPRIDGVYHRRRRDWWQGISRVKLIVSLIVGLLIARWRTIEPAPADRTGLAHLQAQLAQGLAQVAQAIDAYSRGDWPTGNAGERAAHQTLSAYDHAAPAFGLPRTCLT